MRFLKKFISKILFIILILGIIASGYFYQDFYKEQFNKAASYYWIWQGDKLYKKKEIHKSIEAYRKGIKLNPNHYRARYNLANIYVMYEDYLSALELYSQALKINPNYQIARINYAIILSNATYDYDRAIEEYNRAISIKPAKWTYIPFIVDNKETFEHNKGIAYYNLGLAWKGKSLLAGEKNEEAKKYLKNASDSYKSAKEAVGNYDTYYNIGLTEHLLGNLEEAGAYYCKAIKISPLDYEAHYNLAILLKSMKKYRESFDEFKKAGLILDIKGDGVKTRYIYDMLNDTMLRIVANNDYTYLLEHIEEENAIIESRLIDANGKIIISDDLDKAMLKSFEKCPLEKKPNDGEKNAN